jgi:tRNA 2-thiouridine synthesizing protein A
MDKPISAAHRLDCSGHFCPVPIIMTEEKVAEMKQGEVLEVVFTDPGAKPDLMAWCRASGHVFVECRSGKFQSSAFIRKGD